MTKVLFVEDEPLVARMYQKSLALEGIEVETAIGGIEALAKVKTVKPDIIILDIMMPEPNGLEVLDSIKKDPETASIPVVMLSNLSGSRDAELAKEKGALEYWVKKDAKPKELGKKILAAIEKSGKANSVVQPAQPVAATAPTPAPVAQPAQKATTVQVEKPVVAPPAKPAKPASPTPPAKAS